jgi:uncharacterized protein (TIGR03083 family)
MTGFTTQPATETELTEAIAVERRELAGLLSSLPARGWETPSLSAGWRVREVAAHVTMPFRYSTARFAFELLKDRGNFNRMADRCARKDAAAIAPDELIAALRDNAEYPWKPPGGGFEGALVHDVVHGQDIRVPLGSDRLVPQASLRVVLHSLAQPKTLGFFGTDLTGIELSADDIDWSVGTGTRVSGLAQDLALILAGRKLPAGRLRGEPSARFTDS